MGNIQWLLLVNLLKHVINLRGQILASRTALLPCVPVKTSPCMPAPRAHVEHMCAWCWFSMCTRGRFGSTHGGFRRAAPHRTHHRPHHRHHMHSHTTSHGDRDRDKERRQRKRETQEKTRRKGREDKTIFFSFLIFFHFFISIFFFEFFLFFTSSGFGYMCRFPVDRYYF